MVIKEQIKKDLEKAIEKSGILKGNFLDNIEWLLETVDKDNFEDFPKPVPVGKLCPEVQKAIGAKGGFVYLKPRIYAKIRGWWGAFLGHLEITPAHFFLLPLLIYYPERIYQDKDRSDRVLFVVVWDHPTALIVEVNCRGKGNEIVTFSLVRERDLRKLVKVWEEKKRTSSEGTAISPILAPATILQSKFGWVAGCRFSGLRQKVQGYASTVEKGCQADILSYSKVALSLDDIHLEHPQDPEHGDYSSNIAMTLAGKLGKSPMEIADDVLAQFTCPAPNGAGVARQKKRELKFANTVARVEAAGPGFINFWLSEGWLSKELGEVIKEGERYGSSNVGRGKTIIVDYSSPNIAKPFGIGHLRSTIIGQALYNLYKFQGYKVIGDNHLGDWGTQFGRLIYAIKAWGDEERIAEDPIKRLTELYVKFHREAGKDPALEDEGRAWFRRLEGGDKEARRIWRMCVGWSLVEFDRIYKLLGVEIDMALGESFYELMLQDVIDEAVSRKGVAVESKGALVIKFPDDTLPPAIIRKSDGATIYMTRDLATIKYRLQEFKPFKIVYETGVDHALHFKQLFWAAELLGWGSRQDYVHVGHGMMRLKTGRMRTRTGDTILLEEVLGDAVSRAKGVVKEKNPVLDESEAKVVAEAVGIGAVKYNDLSQHYATDVVFDWDKMLNLKGNSGPYLQYTYARCRSVLARAGGNLPSEIGSKVVFGVEGEYILRTIYKFPEIVSEAAETYSPNLICNFLFDLAQKYNLFYNRCPILAAETNELKEFRLMLTAATAQVLKNGLTLLGIEVLERM